MNDLEQPPEWQHIADGTICTYFGVEFNVFQPDPKDVMVGDIAHALANECRFGGHTRHHYSVAQHSVIVSQIAMERDPDLEQIQLIGLLHDAAEAYVGDMPRPIKRAFPAWKTIEDRVQAVIWEAFGIPMEHVRAAEASIKFADLYACKWEQRDLMPDTDWWAKDSTMDELILTPWPAEVARDYFLRELERCT